MKLMILDRDGVINHDSPHYIKKPEEWVPIPKSLSAIAMLHRAGYTVVVATNQSGIERGLYTEAMLARIHHKMQDAVRAEGGSIDKIFYCPHAPSTCCDCRKPKPGLLQAVSAWFGCTLERVPMIGDSLRDIEAARFMRCRPILVLTGNGEKTLQAHSELAQEIEIFPNLFAAAEVLARDA